MSRLSEAKILVVDDEDMLREIYIEYLQKKGIVDIDEAEDGLVALSKCEKKKYDFITLDHRMPNMTGAEALKKIRADGSLNKETKVMVITGYLGDIPVELLKDSHTFFEEKPMSVKKFESIILENL